MKKILLILLVLLLSGCTKETNLNDCLDTETEINGECVLLSGPQLQLYNTLLAMEDYTNYEMDTTISVLDSTHYLTMQVDGSTSYYIDANEDIYYTKDNDICTTITDTLNQITTATVPCSTVHTDPFFRSFDYTWFVLESGEYQLLQEHFQDILPFFSSMIEGVTLEQLSMQISNSKIDNIHVELLLESETYTLDFIFHSYGSVVITLPVE